MPEPTPRPPRPLSDEAFAWAVLICALLFSVALWQITRQESAAAAEERFAYRVAQQRELIVDRMRDYARVLRGAAGLFAASQEVSRSEWQRYVAALDLQHALPGIQGTGFALMIPAADKAAHEAAMRRDFPDYAIFPPGERERYSSIVYLEPFAGWNLRAFGFDMYAEPIRRAAMEQARDSGEPTLSGKVRLLQEGDEAPQPGFLLYVPIYRNGAATGDPEARRRALRGFVYSPFRAGDLMSRLFADPRREVDIELYDGAPAAATLLYASAPGSATDAAYVSTIPIEVAGHQWTARFTGNARFLESTASSLPTATLLRGIVFSLLLFGVLLLAARHQRRMAAANAELARQSRDLQTLAEMTGQLQACMHSAEAYPIVEAALRPLYPERAGACYVLAGDGATLQQAARWGEASPGCARLGQAPCRALQADGPCRDAVTGERDGHCPHLAGGQGDHACIPLVAQGKLLGNIVLEQPATADDAPLRLARTTADALSLALTGLRLREALQRRVRDSEELLRSAIDTIGEAFAIYDADERLVYCNEQYRALYRTSAPLIEAGRSFEEIIRYGVAHGQYREAVGNEAAWIAARLAAHRQGDLDLIQQLDDGRWLRVRERRTASGHSVGFRIDISDLYRAKEAAEAATQVKSNFLATVSHEIRTPLNAIIGLAEVALIDHPLTPALREHLCTIDRSARHLLQLISDILDLTRLEKGRLELAEAPCVPATLIDDLLRHWQPAAAAKGLVLRAELAGDLAPRAIADARRLEQILGNLVDNAIKFTARGEILLRASSADGRLRFTVADSGIGMTAEQVAGVFAAFTQVDGKLNRKYAGIGIGLAICRQLAELMGGTLEVKSTPGLGSEFRLELPLRQPEAAAQALPERLDGLRVLLVGSAAAWMPALADYGITGVAVADADAALRQLDGDLIDLALVTAPADLAALRADYPAATLPIVALSNAAEAAAADACLPPDSPPAALFAALARLAPPL